MFRGEFEEVSPRLFAPFSDQETHSLPGTVLTEPAGEAIGKQIRVVTVPGKKLKAAMSQSGMSPEMAALLVEMEEAHPKIQGQFEAVVSTQLTAVNTDNWN